MMQSSPPAGQMPPPRPARSVRMMPMWLGATSLGVLLAIAVVQTALLVVLSGKANDTSADLREANDRLGEVEEAARTFDERILQVEGRTSGVLNAAEVAEEVLPSVFRVQVSDMVGTAFAFGPATRGGGTSLVTNYHVIESAVTGGGDKKVSIERKERSYTATVVDVDPERDLAILHTSKEFPRLDAAQNTVNSGDPVVVVGAPLGLADTVTTGVVSAVRQDPTLGIDVIQFDAAISPGNSGGPVVNAEGDVVGIASAKIVEDGAEGLGLAIPIATVCEKLLNC